MTVISIMTANAQVIGTPGQGTFVLVQTQDELVGNGRYIIVNAAAGKAMQQYVSGNDNYKSVAVNLNESKDVATIEDASTAVCNLIKNGNKYYFYVKEQKSYLAITNSNNTKDYLKNRGTKDAYSQTTVSIDNGDATIHFNPVDNDRTLPHSHLRYNGVFSCYEAGKQQPVQLYREMYTRKVTKGKYGTLCLPYSADLKNGDVSGATFYTIEGKQTADDVVTAISLVEADTLLAGKPYIFLATDNLLEVRYKGYKADAATENNGLIGSYEATSVDKGMYVINDNQVKRCGANSKIGTNRCYINMDDVPEITEASAGALILSFDDTTTAIESIKTNTGNKSTIYDLSGRQVKAAKKGLYIMNGKKVIK